MKTQSKKPTQKNNLSDVIDQYKDRVVPLDGCESVDSMTVYELARWCSLLEAVEVVGKKCDSLGIPVKSNEWVKPIAFQKFVDERTTSMMFEIIQEIEEGKIRQY